MAPEVVTGIVVKWPQWKNARITTLRGGTIVVQQVRLVAHGARSGRAEHFKIIASNNWLLLECRVL